MQDKKAINIASLISFVLSVILMSVSAFIRVVGEYYFTYYSTSVEALIFTLKVPKTNANIDVVNAAVEWCLPKLMLYIVILLLVIIAEVILCILHKKKPVIIKINICYRFLCILSATILTVFTWNFLNSELDIEGYLVRKSEDTKFYEEYYVNPDSVEITCESDTVNNLIYIYLESMESSYFYENKKTGETVNLIPNLTKLASDNVSFSETGELGGFYSPVGTDWTMAGLLATSSGIPFSFPVDGNGMIGRSRFAPGLTALGDILEEKGYVQEFCCGSDFSYGGRESYYLSHGNWKTFDFFDAYPGGGNEYNIGWWGIEDAKLYEYAKDELTELASQGEPFDFNLLTVDTHFGDWEKDGYVCQLCTDEYEDRYANVIKCADKQLGEFLEWLEKQDFYENTTIIITGDHPFMGTPIKEVKEYGGTVYNCIINSRKETDNSRNRICTSFDIFPTTLSAMGFDIEGNKLGLGVDLFSSEKTIAELIGMDRLNEELSKYSQYYVDNFE